MIFTNTTYPLDYGSFKDLGNDIHHPLKHQEHKGYIPSFIRSNHMIKHFIRY